MISFKQFLLLEGQLEDSLMRLGASEEDAKKAIARWNALTDRQKKEKLPNPQQYTKKRGKTFEDFLQDLEKAEEFVSDTARENNVSERGIKGLEKGKDYVGLETGNPDIQAYAPMSWEASKLIASKDVGGTVGKWCTAYQKESKYWDSYIGRRGGVLIYFVTPETKYAVIYFANMPWMFFDANDKQHKEDVLKEQLPEMYSIVEELSKHYEQLRKNLDDNLSLPEILKKMKIENYKIRPDNKVDIDGDLILKHYRPTTIPEKVQFGKVDGNFICRNNRLTSLKNAPEYVSGHFDCKSNRLSSLEGSPKEVGMSFNCSENKLTTLEGAPQEIGGDFVCESTDIHTLKGSPRKVGGNFDCSWNSSTLKSLEGSPEYVGGNFICNWNTNLSDVDALNGGPKYIGGDFICQGLRVWPGKPDIATRLKKAGIELKGEIKN